MSAPSAMALRLFPKARERRGTHAAVIAAGPTCLAALVFAFGPRVFPLMLPDSKGYLTFSAVRSALYPTFLQGLQSIGLAPAEIVWVQFAIYLVTLFVLLFVLAREGWPIWIILLFGSAIALNIYFIGLHATILTESLVFSLQNLFLLCLVGFLRSRSTRWVAMAALIVGLTAGIRPALWSQAMALLLVVAFLAWGDLRGLLRHLLVAAMVLVVAIALEAGLFKLQHDERESLLPTHLFGKAAMLSTDPSFRLEGLTSELQELAEEVDRAFDPVQGWLAETGNPFVRAVRAADFEVLAQYQLLRKRIPALAAASGRSAADLKSGLGWAAIDQNRGAFVELTATHYLGLWSVHALRFFDPLGAGESGVPLPFADKLSVGSFDDSSTPLALFVFPAFLGLGAVLLGLTLFAMVRLPFDLVHWRPLRLHLLLLFAVSLATVVQANLVATSIVSVSTPRYLMASYPFAVLAALLVMAWLLRRLHETRKGIAA